jgi:hypothetical protein
MGRERRSAVESASWFDASQVFADTQRVDLFNDPPWDTAHRPPQRRAVAAEGSEPSRWTMAKSAAVGRLLSKRGQHSHKPG